MWSLGGALLIVRATTTPAYLAVYLPANVLTALGVALLLPQLSSVAVQGLPADQFAAGSAVVQAVRYIGSTVGVALAIALLDAATTDPLDGFRRNWVLIVACGLVVSVVSTRLTGRSVVAPSARHSEPVGSVVGHSGTRHTRSIGAAQPSPSSPER